RRPSPSRSPARARRWRTRSAPPRRRPPARRRPGHRPRARATSLPGLPAVPAWHILLHGHPIDARHTIGGIVTRHHRRNTSKLLVGATLAVTLAVLGGLAALTMGGTPPSVRGQAAAAAPPAAAG